MKYLLDSSTCVAHLRGRAPEVSERLLAAGTDSCICAVVVTELAFGALRSRDPAVERARLERFLAGVPSLPLDGAGAEQAATIRAELAAIGAPIGPYDVLIAGIAMAHGLTLVTCNVREFQRVRGLRVETWIKEEPEWAASLSP